MARIKNLHVNGKSYPIDADPAASLLSVLREQLDITGAKYGCGEGQCGACTVLIDGSARRSCITSVASVGSKPIVTIEGIEQDGKLHPVQEAFLSAGALQCGYCTPGMILSAVALLRVNPSPSEQEISHAMEGNVCRCGTYPLIVAAIRRSSQTPRESGQRESRP